MQAREILLSPKVGNNFKIEKKKKNEKKYLDLARRNSIRRKVTIDKYVSVF